MLLPDFYWPVRFSLNSHTYIKPVEMFRFYIDALREKSLNLEYESSKLAQQNTH